MATIVLHSPLKSWQPGDRMVQPYVEIAVDGGGQSSERKSRVRLLTERLATEKQIDDAVDKLISELEHVRMRGKSELRVQMSRTISGIPKVSA